MTRSRQIAVTIIGTLAVAAVVMAVVRSRPSPQPAPAAHVASYTQVAHGDVVDSVPELDSSALNALERMGAYLRTLKAFQLKADVVTEDVRTDGQKVQTIRNVDLVAKRPSLRSEVDLHRHIAIPQLAWFARAILAPAHVPAAPLRGPRRRRWL